ARSDRSGRGREPTPRERAALLRSPSRRGRPRRRVSARDPSRGCSRGAAGSRLAPSRPPGPSADSSRAPTRRGRPRRRGNGRAVLAASAFGRSVLASVPGDEGLPVEVPEGRRGDGGGTGAQRYLDEVVDAIRGRQAERDRAQPEEDAPATALPEPEAPNATDAPRGVVPDQSTRPNLAQRAGRDGHTVDLVVV